MADPSPFDESSLRWSLTSMDDEGLRVFCVSIEQSHYAVKLWVFYRLIGAWRLLCSYDSDFLAHGHHYCTLCSCQAFTFRLDAFELKVDEEEPLIVVYCETSENMACLLFFKVLDNNGEADPVGAYSNAIYQDGIDPLMNIRFDNTTGPQIVDYEDNLYVGGSLLMDFGALFRVFRIVLNHEDNKFFYEQVYSCDMTLSTLTSSALARLIVWNDRLTLVQPEKISCINLPATAKCRALETQIVAVSDEIRPTSFSALSFFMLDCSAAHGTVSTMDQENGQVSLLWLLHSFGFSKLTYDQSTKTYLWHDFSTKTIKDTTPVEILDSCKKCLSSKTGVLSWVDQHGYLSFEKTEVESLQILCVESFIKHYPVREIGVCVARNILLSYIPVNICKKYMPFSFFDTKVFGNNVITLS